MSYTANKWPKTWKHVDKVMLNKGTIKIEYEFGVTSTELIVT